MMDNQTSQEWQESQEELERFVERAQERLENSGEFRYTAWPEYEENWVEIAEFTGPRKPAGSACHPMQMELFDRKEVA